MMQTRRFAFWQVVCAVVVCLNMASFANAESKFMAFRQGNMHYAEISLNVEDGVSVRMLKDGDSDWTDFGGWGDEFDIESDMFDSIAGLNAEIAGSYTMEIVHSGGTSVYTFDIQALQSAWFPANPMLAFVPDQIPQQYEFSWTWDGTADRKYVEYEVWNLEGNFDFEQEYLSSDPGFNDKAFLADSGACVGMGEFFVVYANLGDGLVANWALQSGPDIFGGQSPMQYVASEAMAEFGVVPEPTTLGLLALGGLAMIRRRRTA